MRIFIFIFLTLIIISATPIKQHQVQIGVLEVVDESKNTEFSKDYTCIRPLFKKIGNKWLFSKNSKIKYWNVISKNNVITKLLALADSSLINSSSDYENCQLIKSGNKIPKIGKMTHEYSGWPYAPAYKPLVVNSTKHCNDSQNWKIYKPLISEKDSIIQWLKRKHKISKNVKLLDNKFKTISYSSSDSSKKLICLHLNENSKLPIIKERCYPDCGYNNSWFYIENDKIQFLHSMLLLIAIGDFDNDGKNEFLFKKQAYNNDGYIMFYNNFNQFIMQDWSYH